MRRPSPPAALRGLLLRARLGALAGGRPASAHWGRDRGTPVDRRLIERFLLSCASDVRGDVLEVRDDAYARRFGGDRLRRVDVLDIDARNPRATIVADLEDAPVIPDAAYDCVLLTQVLQYVPHPAAALAEVRRILRPDGVLLLTLPCLSRLDLRNPIADRHRFTPAGVAELLEIAFPGRAIAVEAAGNLAAAAAFLHGLAAEELGDALDPPDPRYPVVVLARVAPQAQASGAMRPPASDAKSAPA